MGGGLQSQIRSNRLSRHGLAVLLAGFWLSALWLPVRLQAAPADWQLRLRQLVQQQELTKALVIAEDQLSEHPEDLEARGWRARLLAWTHRWNESEIEYRAVLQSAPRDTDILVGLADLLTWQERPTEAIALLDQASVLDAGRNDVQLRRGRLLHALGRRAEAGAAYARVLSLDGLSVGLKDGLAMLSAESQDEAYGSQPFDFLNFTGGHGWFELGWQWRFEFRSGGRPQTSNGMNYAIRF